MDKIKECIHGGLTCDRSRLGCFNTTLKDQSKCKECLFQLLEEHDYEYHQVYQEKIQQLKKDIKSLDKYHDGIVNIYEIFGLIDNIFNS